MANYQQPQQSNTYGQYFGYGSGIQYDSSNSQNKWGTSSNTGNQTNLHQNQNQQQVYQAAAQNYGVASGFYGQGHGGDQVYGQQQNYTSSTGSADSNVNGTRNASSVTGSASSATTGHKPVSFNNSAGGAGTTNMSYTSGFGSTGGTGSFNSTVAENKSGMNTQNQMVGAAYGNSNQNTGMSSNMGNNMNNMSMAATSQTQSFGSTVTSDTLGQFNQMSQLFGNGANYGAYTSGDTSGGNFSAGYNQALNTGMMTLLQQTLMQQANSGGAAFGMGTGNSWGMSDGDGGFYAPPVDSNYPSGSDLGSGGGKQGKKGKRWSGKDIKQDFYGNRFAQMFTGMPGILGQSQTGTAKGKRLMNGVRFNVKGEKVIDVEIPLPLYSRWGQLRKFFSKQDTEVAKHLIEFHDEMCEDCMEREQRKKKKADSDEQADTAGEGETQETELSEEDLMIRQVMGFGNFNTTREAMVEDNQVDSAASASVSDTSAKSATSWEAKAGFIGPQQPDDKPLNSESGPEKEKGPILSDEEKHMMDKLGWSVFNKKDDNNGDEVGDDVDDDEEKMDDGGKDETAAEGQ